MGLLPLSYRRPSYVERPGSGDSQTTLQDEGGSEKIGTPLESVRSTDSRGIPESLGFDKILEGGTCPVSPARLNKSYQSHAKLTFSEAYHSP